MTDSLPDLDQLIAMLGDSAERDSVPTSLQDYGEAAVDPLIAALQNESEDTREGVLWAINRLRNSSLAELLAPAAIESLSAMLLQEPSSRLRLHILKTLMTLAGSDDHETIIDTLLAVLADEHEAVRAEAVRHLAQMNDAQALKPLVSLAESDSADRVRGRAAYALAYLEPTLEALQNSGGAGSDALLMALSDPELSVRLRVIWALGEMKNSQALRPLMAILDGEAAVQEKRKAAEALGAIGDREALEPLIMALQFSSEEDVKRAAATALGELGDKGAVDVLLHSLRHEPLPGVRASAARALETLADARAVDDLILALEDSDDGVRLRATLALSAIGDKGAVAPLKRLLSIEGSHQIRAAASQAVETLEGK
jgi:HEAT repeat protein